MKKKTDCPYRKLKEDVSYSEEEIDNLKRKNQQLQAAISSPGGNNPRDKVLQRLLQENPAPENLVNQLDSSFVSSSTYFVNLVHAQLLEEQTIQCFYKYFRMNLQ